jgi:hypothetical protein
VTGPGRERWSSGRRPVLVLGGLCAIAVGVRLWTAWEVPAPWIMTDELTYRELAGSIASGGGFDVRGHSIGLAGLYPLLLAPLWLLRAPLAYDLSKLVDVLAMTSVAPIVYLWGRRVASSRAALAAAAGALLLPAFVYTGELMTESLALPTFVLAAFAIAEALPHPSARRQALALGAILVASAVRPQGFVLLPVWLTAVVVWALVSSPSGRPGRVIARELARYVPAGAAVLALAAVYLAALAARGESAGQALGFYRGAAVVSSYDAGAALGWVGYHVAELSLAAGLLPAAALLELSLTARRSSPAVKALAAVTLAATVWLVLVAGVWASRSGNGIRERYVIYALPLLLLCFGARLERVPAVSRRATLGIAICCCFAPVALPLHRLLGAKALSDGPSLGGLYWLRLHASLGAAEIALWLTALLALLVTALLGRKAPAAPLALVAILLLANSVAETDLAQGQARRVHDGADAGRWVDEKLGGSADAALLFTGNVDPMLLWQTEFWNTSVRRAYVTHGAKPDPLPSTRLSIDDRTGRLVAPGGGQLNAGALVTDRSLVLSGPVLARSRTGLLLYRYGSTTVVRQAFTGLYPDDWTAPAVTYERPGCRGVTRLIFAFAASAYAGVQRVVATQDGTVVGSETTVPGQPVFLRSVLDAARGSCRLRIAITPWTPARSQRGSTDTRRLGLLYERVVALP